MVKFSLRLLAICFWLHTFAFITTLVIVAFQPDFTFAHLILFAIIIVVTYFSGRLLWSKSNVLTSKLIRANKSYQRNNPVEARSFVKVSTEIMHETPTETLNEMQKYYSNESFLGDLRILEESVSLMESTKDIDTFLSRSELALRTSLTLEQSQKVDIHVSANFLSSREIMELKLTLLPNLLEKAYLKISSEAAKLKTAKGQIGRYEKFANYLKEHEFELDISSNYEHILSLTNEQISKFYSNINN